MEQPARAAAIDSKAPGGSCWKKQESVTPEGWIPKHGTLWSNQRVYGASEISPTVMTLHEYYTSWNVRSPSKDNDDELPAPGARQSVTDRTHSQYYSVLVMDGLEV